MKLNKIIIAIILLVTLSVSLSSNGIRVKVDGYSGEIKSVWFKNNEYVLCHIGYKQAGIAMRNKTKDDLEIELLRLQIKKLNKSNE
jgi:hypothetical protein